jgi:hypothetical protein
MIHLGEAFLTATTIISPIDAYLLFDHPKTLIHITCFAHVLSATDNLV